MPVSVGRIPEQSDPPQWPAAPTAPAGAPNVLLVLTDDVGYGACSTFGGPIPTPTLDDLAESGVRYTEFHTTAMCSPTRAALLTGHNHHDVGFGRITESAMAYDGYTSIIPPDARTIAEILRRNGYATALIGKCHNVPDWESGPAGPFERWPTGLGFEYFYGFLGGGTNNFSPGLFRGTTPIEAPDDPGYHIEADLADEAIAWVRRIKSTAPGKPFFLHYSTAAAHSPHHAPDDWLDRYRGKYDEGWDVVREQTLARQKELGVVPNNTRLTERPEEIPAWDSLSADQQRLYARQMEVYAAALAYSDAQFGRLIDALRDLGELDNTLVVFIQGDNGASAEGGLNGELNEAFFMNGLHEDVDTILEHIHDLGTARSYNHYSVGWAHAMDTPFKWFKQVASHFGGTRNGMVIRHPGLITDAGGIRSQFHHVVDIAPTVLELAGLEPPSVMDGVSQRPMAGVSMVYTFDQPSAKSTRNTQYFELHGNRAIYHDGWVAACGPVEMPWAFKMPPPDLDEIPWELYHVADDYSQAVDLAAEYPDRLRELQDLFWIEAAHNRALPIVVGTARRVGPPQPSAVRGRSEFTFYPGTIRVPPGSAPDVVNRSFDIVAEMVVPDGGADGVLYAHGGRFGGHALYVFDGRPVYHYNLLGSVRYTLTAEVVLTPGAHTVTLGFASDGQGYGLGGTATLSVDGQPCGSTHFDRTVPWRMSYVEGMDIGLQTGTAVSEDFRPPFAFGGTLHKVTLILR